MRTLGVLGDAAHAGLTGLDELGAGGWRARGVRRLVGAGVAAALVGLMAAPGLYAHDVGLGLVRYNPDGTLDAGFGRGGVVAERTVQGGLSPEALVVQPDGKIVLAGTASDLATAAVGFGLARYNADGTLDVGFGAGGRVLTRLGAATAEAHAVALQPNGDILVAGSAFGADAAAVSNFAVARYTPDGSLDRSFGQDGRVLTPLSASGAEARAIVLQPDSRIVVAGTAFARGATPDTLAMARYNADGGLDQSFGSSGSLTTLFDAYVTDPGPFRCAALLIQADQKLVAVGSTGGHQGAFALARYLPGGDLDSTFGAGGTTITHREASTQAYAAALQADGRIVVGGGVGAESDSAAFALARYDSHGDLDPGFGAGGFITTTFEGAGSGAHALTLDARGELVAAGAGYASALPPLAAGAPLAPVSGGFALVRYLADGTPDPSFGKAGVVITTVGNAGSMPAAAAVQSDGKLVATGLTYFLVPAPSDDRLTLNRLLIVAGLGLLVVSGLMLIVLRQRRGRTSRAARSRIGPEPGA